jgi:hypothetical protein
VALEAATALTHYYGVLLVAVLSVAVVLRRPASTRALRAWGASRLVLVAAVSWWVPILCVQAVALPRGMTAHLAAGLSPWELALALGPGPAHPWGAAAATGTVLAFIAACAGAWRLAWVGRGEPSSPAAPTARRSSFLVSVAAIVAAMALPLVPPLAMHLTQSRLDVLSSQYGLAYAVIAGLTALACAAAFLRSRVAASWSPPLPVLTLAGVLAAACAAALVRESLSVRNFVLLVPMAAHLAGIGCPRGRLGTILATALLLAFAIPSLMRAPEAFEPRQQLRECAAKIASHGPSATFALPRWDAPGIAHYLGAGSVEGILSPDELPPAADLPRSVHVVLTREAAEARADWTEAVSARLAPRFALAASSQYRGTVLLRYHAVQGGEP